MLLEGIFLPLTTPFHSDGRLNLPKLQSNVDRYSRTPAAGMLVGSAAGEADSLNDEEKRQVLLNGIEAAADSKVMIASVGCPGVACTLHLAETAAQAGYDAVVVGYPAFAAHPALRAELLTYVRVIADRSALPVILAGERGSGVDLELLGELAQHPNLLGWIDAEASPSRVQAMRALTAEVSREVTVTPIFAAVTGRMQRKSALNGSFVALESLGTGAGLTAAPAAPALKMRKKRVGFQVLAGATAGMLEAWQAGAAGGVSRLGACAPQGCCEVWQAFKDGDQALAAEKQERVRAIGERVEGWAGIAALKHGCDFNGYFGGRPRLPFLPLTAVQRREMEVSLESLRN